MNGFSTNIAPTSFAPAERVPVDVLEQQRQTVLLDEVVDALMQAMPGYVMLVNQQRQIVALNRNVLCISGISDENTLIGKRPGELFNCVHADDSPGGCGTGAHCSVCGAVRALLDSQESGGQAVRECLVTLKGREEFSLEMQATATPILIRDQRFTVFVLQDISGEKRREVLEQLFFHDVINTAGGIYGLASLLSEEKELPEHVESDYKRWLVVLSENLIEEIRSQRCLLDAEKGTFMPELSDVDVRSVLLEINRLYQHHEKTPGRLLLLEDGPAYTVRTDVAILRRIIGNMAINALEATPVGGTVTLSTRSDGSRVTIEVRNQGEIPADVQLQIFKRSFSTKSSTGRGIGTYSMKLFGERYLKGTVSFRSSLAEGTVFSFSLPLAP